MSIRGAERRICRLSFRDLARELATVQVGSRLSADMDQSDTVAGKRTGFKRMMAVADLRRSTTAIITCEVSNHRISCFGLSASGARVS
jgi:hypothetical protein